MLVIINILRRSLVPFLAFLSLFRVIPPIKAVRAVLMPDGDPLMRVSLDDAAALPDLTRGLHRPGRISLLTTV